MQYVFTVEEVTACLAFHGLPSLFAPLSCRVSYIACPVCDDDSGIYFSGFVAHT